MQIRPITESDYPGVQALHRTVGWPQRSLAGWRRLHDNPIRRVIDAPAGWVADGPDGEIAAHAGNLIQRFHMGDRTFYGATGFSIIVSPAARGVSRKIIQTFTQQKGIFAAYTLNANGRSQPLYARQGLRPWPETTHATKLSWPVAPLSLAMGRALKGLHRLLPDQVSRLPEQLMNDRLGCIPSFEPPKKVSVLTDFRDESRWTDFWRALNTSDRMLSDRSAEALRWRLADPDLTQPPLVLGYTHGDVIFGYAMAMMAKGNIIEPPVLEIIDLEALDGHADAIPTLMQGLMKAARAMGAAKVRLQTVAPRTLERLGNFARTSRREGGWGHCHVHFADDAPDPALWSPTPYDGDYAICLRPVPLTASRRTGHAFAVASTLSEA